MSLFRLKLMAIIFSFYSCDQKGPEQDQVDRVLFQTNEKMISTLYSQINLNKPETVFESIFKSLPGKVIIYPSENYYYFKFYSHGQLYMGSFLFSASNRDSGKVYFGYSQKVDRKLQGGIKAKGNSYILSKKTGVEVLKRSSTKYELKYKDKSVIFVMNHPELRQPVKAKLLSSERYIGPSFDESGLQFHLLFDTKEKHLFWVLNEDVYVPEEFEEIDRYVIIGKRTSFAFYQDRINTRKILIAVSGWNLFQNNWFDGPFDQLPDNYVYTGQLEIKSYIEAAYPSSKGKIDIYGAFTHESGRVAVIPYSHYYQISDLNFVKEYKSQGLTGSRFYKEITRTKKQL